jgi:small-conductance mechanosensitive channel
MNPQTQFLLGLKDVLNTQFLPVGKTSVSLFALFYVAVLFALLVIFTGKIQRWVVKDMLQHTPVEPGLRSVVGSIVRYVLLFIGFIVILQTAGVDLSALTVVVGALGLGVSFGLQSLVTNIVAGFIIIAEGPFKVGDRIEFDGTTGSVMKVTLRATTIVTNDNIAIIVPNSELIKGKVTNWSADEGNANHCVRFNFPIPADPSVDPEVVMQTLMEVASAHPGVLPEPAPDVVLQDLTDKTFNYMLRVYTRDYLSKPSSLRSELNKGVHKAFKAKGILFATKSVN